MKIVNRVKKYEEFQAIINQGKFLRNDSFNVYFQLNNRGYTRFGISIPKKSGDAVIRNRMKRQIRAAIVQKCDYTLPYDIIVIARKTYEIENFQKTLADLADIVQKVGQTE